MSNRLLIVIISSLLFLILIAGCNKGSSPTLPDANEDISQQPVKLDLAQFPEGRTVIGAFNAEINFETGEATVEPMRTGANHFSIFGLLQNPNFCPGGCFKIQILEIDEPNGYFKLKTTVINPTSISVWDLRTIIYDNPLNNHKILNPDDYTKLWAPPGYSGVYPFIAYAKNDDDREITSTSSFSEIVEFKFKSMPPKWIFPFVVDCSFPSNCQEPYIIHDQNQIGEFFSDHGCIKMSVKVGHHQGPSHIESVTVDTSPLTGGPTDLAYNFADDTWEALIINELLVVAPGPYDMLITATATGTDIKLYDYFHIDVQPSGTSENVSGTISDIIDGIGIPTAMLTTSNGVDLFQPIADYCGFYATSDIPQGSRVFSVTKPGYYSNHAMSVVSDEDIIYNIALAPNPNDPPDPPLIVVNEDMSIDLTTGVVVINGTMSNMDCFSNQVGVYIHQGNEYIMDVDDFDDSFETAILLSYGTNVICFRATNATATVLSDPIEIEYYPEWNFRITLTWDTDQTDIDLHVWEPDWGQHCYYMTDFTTHLELDVDDVYGYGPENITPTTDSVPEGVYPIAVNYYAGDDYEVDIPTTATLTLRLNLGTPYEEIKQFQYMLTMANNNSGYPINSDTASWWRPCDLVMGPDGIAAWQPPDPTYYLPE
ncbi:MAG: hypothetical protein NTY09_06465 [bacterium]|nr:hypothetical protein [bacterium]